MASSKATDQFLTLLNCSVEEYFIPDPNQPNQLNIGVLNTVLNRALATVKLLEGDGDEIDIGFRSQHEVVLSALSQIRGDIEQASAVVMHAIRAE